VRARVPRTAGSQPLPPLEPAHFVGSHLRAFAFFGGVVRALVPDNLKSGVIKANY
jgi:hypothetical protein